MLALQSPDSGVRGMDIHGFTHQLSTLPSPAFFPSLTLATPPAVYSAALRGWQRGPADTICSNRHSSLHSHLCLYSQIHTFLLFTFSVSGLTLHSLGVTLKVSLECSFSSRPVLRWSPLTSEGTPHCDHFQHFHLSSLIPGLFKVSECHM